MDKILFLNEKDRNTGLSLEHSDYRYKTAKPVAATKPKHDEVGFTIPYAMFRPIREPGLLCELLGDNPVRRTADLKMNFDFLVKDLYENEISRLKAGFTLEAAKEMVKDQIEIDFSQGREPLEYDPQLFYEVIREFIEQDAEDGE